MPLFPPEIINDTTESLFVKRKASGAVVYWVVLLAVASALAALPFIHVKISTQARGIIRSPFENNQLQTSVYGEVIDIRIVENAQVQKGDTLIVLNFESVQIQIENIEEKIREDSAFVSDIANLLARTQTSLITPKYLNENNLYRASLDEQQTKISYLKNELSVTESLYMKNVTSKSEYLQVKNNYETAVRQRNNVREQILNRWQSEQTAYELEIKRLWADISRFEDEKTKYVIKAPTMGSIIQFSGIQVGNFIAPSQIIAQISTDNDLLVECYVSPVDIGFIQVGQQVRFQLDAFNYNQWGMAHGEVQEIPQDIVIMNEQPVFRIRCSLDNKVLCLKNGYAGSLKKGMTLTSRFSLTERTLWQLLFDKVDDWLNPASPKEEK
jgi:HlyD family secretion protein